MQRHRFPQQDLQGMRLTSALPGRLTRPVRAAGFPHCQEAGRSRCPRTSCTSLGRRVGSCLFNLGDFHLRSMLVRRHACLAVGQRMHRLLLECSTCIVWLEGQHAGGNRLP